MSKHLMREIERLKKQLLTLSAVVERSVQQAAQAVGERDAKLAEKIIVADEEIDQMEVDVEEECLKILALHQPVAVDLRFVVAVLKINNDLERIGDLAVNIAERTIFLSHTPPVDFPFDFATMSDKSQTMLRHSLDALVNADTQLAYEVGASDDEVDAINRDMYYQVQEAIGKHPDKVSELINLLGVSRDLERIADYATNIAEDVIYMINGEIVRHRPEVFSDSHHQ